MRSGKNGSTLLTEGSILGKLFGFAVPLFLGNLFQQLYNTCDSLIVGNFVGSEALAAVSSSGSLIFLLVGLFNGIAMGAGVVIARYFGARDPEHMRRAIHSTVFFGIVAGLALTVLGILLTPQLLRWMGTPEAVEAGFDAGAVIKAISGNIKGGGGGKAAMAQAGGKDASGIDAALEAAREMLL